MGFASDKTQTALVRSPDMLASFWRRLHLFRLGASNAPLGELVRAAMGRFGQTTMLYLIDGIGIGIGLANAGAAFAVRPAQRLNPFL